VARRLARYPEIPLGIPTRTAEPDRGEPARPGAVLRSIDADDFVYDPDADARSRTDLRAFAILGATLLVGLVVTGCSGCAGGGLFGRGASPRSGYLAAGANRQASRDRAVGANR